MMLSEKLILATRNAGVKRGAQVRVEQALARWNFTLTESEGCWVRPSLNARVYVDGANWVFYYVKDAANKPTHSGAGPNEFNLLMETL